VATPAEEQLRRAGGYFLCENAISAWEQRGVSHDERSLFSRQVFSFAAPYAFSIARAFQATTGDRFPSGAYRIDTPRNGLYGAECGVMPGTEWAYACVWDGRTGLRIGNCAADDILWFERFPAWAMFHPSTDIAAIGTGMAFDYEAVQWTICSLHEHVAQRYFGPCYQAVGFADYEGDGWMHHVVVLPDLGSFEAFIEGEQSENTQSAILAGVTAERLEGFEPLECLENTAGLTLCVLP
jgi:hypothetical protein